MFTGPGKIGPSFSSMVISHGMRRGMSLPSLSSGIGRPKFKGFSDGGGIAKRAWGGPMMGGGSAAPDAQAMPSMAARGLMQPPYGAFSRPFAEGGMVSEPEKPESTFLHGDTGGRADKIITKSPNGSYIVPADVVSHLGEGNSEAGGKIIHAMLSKLEKDRPNKLAIGGSPDGKGVPVALSHGEFQVSPRHVALIGHGSLRRGHEILDKWVQQTRDDHIKTLKKLKPPVGAKKAA